MAETINTTITLDELKSFLWGAAVRLRGQIDAAGYKEYIFPLLFFKRISDVYDEETEDAITCIDVRNEWWIVNPNFKEE